MKIFQISHYSFNIMHRPFKMQLVISQLQLSNHGKKIKLLIAHLFGSFGTWTNCFFLSWYLTLWLLWSLSLMKMWWIRRLFTFITKDATLIWNMKWPKKLLIMQIVANKLIMWLQHSVLKLNSSLNGKDRFNPSRSSLKKKI